MVAMAIGFFYLLFTTHLSAARVVALAQSLGNLWGLSLAILMVGYGLVEIPRLLWYRSNHEKRIQYLTWRLAQLQNEKDEAYDRVDECVYLFQHFENKFQKSPLLRQQKKIVNETLEKHGLHDKQVVNPDITLRKIKEGIDRDEISEKLLGNILIYIYKYIYIYIFIYVYLYMYMCIRIRMTNVMYIAKIHTELKMWIFELERGEAWWYKTAHDILTLEMSVKQKKGSKHVPLTNSGLIKQKWRRGGGGMGSKLSYDGHKGVDSYLSLAFPNDPLLLFHPIL
ncbi:hypothetical protein RFI_09762 [Reticulomyxa filosa]|uniref:Uncharacterized protein n=1 Tax=Reticulomyxa filosa TaxID=46433 RepID=X6NMA8_RETFI|nr:hypothetical protein RFI_09762 [Reticulomyxa filosa]|eukprot:ETO27370.1 hypothetical protein RFI_09762 [Reticulomyxa filosa]